MILGVGRGPIPSQGPIPQTTAAVPELLLRPLTSADPSTPCTHCTLCSHNLQHDDGYAPALTDYRPSHQRPIQVHLSPSFLLHPFDLTIIRLKLSIRANRILLWLLSHIYLYQRNLPQSTRRLNCVKPLGRGYGLNMFFCPLFSICNSG